MVSKPFGVIRLAEPVPVESTVFICASDWSVIPVWAERTTDAALRMLPCSSVIVAVVERFPRSISLNPCPEMAEAATSRVWAR